MSDRISGEMGGGGTMGAGGISRRATAPSRAEEAQAREGTKGIKHKNIPLDPVSNIVGYLTHQEVSRWSPANGYYNETLNTLKLKNIRLKNIRPSELRDGFKAMVAGLGFEQEIPAYMYDGCRVLRGHGNYVLSVTQLRDGRIASGSWDKTIRVWGSVNELEVSKVSSNEAGGGSKS